MKRTMTATILLCSISLLATDTPPPGAGLEQPGRYQIIYGIVDTTAGPIHAIFRLDTATGQTWRYQETPVPLYGTNDILLDHWDPVGEDYLAQLTALATNHLFKTASITNQPWEKFKKRQ